MKSRLHDRNGATVAEVETEADDGVLVHNGRFFTPVTFSRNGVIDWDLMGTEYAEVTARVIACEAPRSVMQIRDRLLESLQAQFQTKVWNVHMMDEEIPRHTGTPSMERFLRDLANNVAQGLADLLQEDE